MGRCLNSGTDTRESIWPIVLSKLRITNIEAGDHIVSPLRPINLLLQLVFESVLPDIHVADVLPAAEPDIVLAGAPGYKGRRRRVVDTMVL